MNDYDLIAGSGLFDRDYYRAAHGLPPDEDAINHFLIEGASLGYMPSPAFDPAVYKLNRPGEASPNPLPAYIRRRVETPWADRFKALFGAGRVDPFVAGGLCPAAPRGLKALFPDLEFQTTPRAIPPQSADFTSADRASATPEAARSLASAGSCFITDQERRIELFSPPSSYLLEAIENDEPLKIGRWTHGAFETLADLKKLAEAIQERAGGLFSPEEILNLSARLHFRDLSASPQVNEWWLVFTDDYLLETHLMLKRIREPSPVTAAAAFKGYPTLDNRPFVVPGTGRDNCPKVAGMLDQFHLYFDQTERLLDGTYFKRGVISGGFRDLPRLCRDHPVLVLGPSWVADLGRRWGLEQFQYLPVAYNNAFVLRYKLLEDCRRALSAAVAAGGRMPVFFLECGSISSWLIYRLAADYPDCMMLDTGQALNAWKLHDPMANLYPWTRVNRQAIVVNLGLEETFRRELGRDYDGWFEAA